MLKITFTALLLLVGIAATGAAPTKSQNQKLVVILLDGYLSHRLAVVSK